jgi:flagellar FliJ protein
VKRFVFRLETALDHRRRLEEQRRTELAEVQGRLHRELERLDEIIEQRAQSMRNAKAERVGHISPSDAEARERFLVRLEEEIGQQKVAIGLIEREVETKVRAVVAATQETQALENLRERHLQEYRAEELREEQKFLDDIASIRAGRIAAEAKAE